MNIYYFKKNYYIIWISFFFALILEDVIFSQKFFYYKPDFVFLFLIYWVIFFPHKINTWSGFFLGILIDIIQGFNLGLHSLVYVIFCYLISSKDQIFRNMVLLKQSFFCFFFL